MKSNHVGTSFSYIMPLILTDQVKESLFPCKLSSKNTRLAEEAVQLAVNSWGKRALTELEAEERLSYACEKVRSNLDSLTIAGRM